MPGHKIEVARQILEQPERVKAHVQADEPPWIVIARSRVFGSLQVIESGHGPIRTEMGTTHGD